MPVRTGRSADPFDDADFLAGSRARRHRQALRSSGPALMLIAFIVFGSYMIHSWMRPRTTAIALRGSDVAQLAPDAAVVMDGIRVGSVDKVRLENGQAVADLLIDKEVAEQIPARSRFKVETLNEVMPGNVGVKISSSQSPAAVARPMDAEPALGGRSLSQVREALADESVLPASTPTGMYLLIGAAILVGSVALGITWKVARSAWMGYLLSAVAIGAIIYLFWNGTLKLDDVQNWVDWAVHALQGATEPSSPPTIPIPETAAPTVPLQSA